MLLVANYPSSVGYAWWLMESYWSSIAGQLSPRMRVMLAYPQVDTVPAIIANAPLEVVERDFTKTGPLEALRQAWWLRKHRVRALYLTDQDSLRIAYGLFRLVGVREILVHDHTPGNRTPATGLRRLLKTAVHQLSPFRASVMIGATEFVTQRHRIVNCFPRHLCFTVRNGLPDSEVAAPADLQATFGVPDGRFVVVGVGRITPIKNVETVLRALRILRVERQRRDVHYLHLGDGPQLTELKTLAEALGIADAVTFAGRIENVAAVLPACHVGIHLSRGEVGYSLSILEFMKASLPAVVSDDPSVGGATTPGVSGLLVDPTDAAAAANALERLVVDRALRQSMGEAAALAQREGFSLASAHASLRSVVERMLAE